MIRRARRPRRRPRKSAVGGLERLESRALLSAFVVNSTPDAPDASPGDGVALTIAGLTSLRAAVEEANVSPGPDSIELPAGMFLLDPDFGPLPVADDLTITGAGRESTRIDASAIDSVFHVDGGVTLTLNHLTAGGTAQAATLDTGATLTLIDAAAEPGGSEPVDAEPGSGSAGTGNESADTVFPQAPVSIESVSTGRRQTELLIGLFGQLTAVRRPAPLEPLLLTRPIIVDLTANLTARLDATLGLNAPPVDLTLAQDRPLNPPDGDPVRTEPRTPRTGRADSDIPSGRTRRSDEDRPATGDRESTDPGPRRRDVIRSLFQNPPGEVPNAVQPAAGTEPPPDAGKNPDRSQPSAEPSPAIEPPSAESRPVPPPLPDEPSARDSSARIPDAAVLIATGAVLSAGRSGRWRRAWQVLSRWVGLAG